MKIKIGIKFIILIILIMFSIFQIERLWFEENASHSFFRYVPQGKVINPAEEVLLEPQFIALYSGETKGKYLLPDSAGVLFHSIQKDTRRLLRQLPEMTEISGFPYENLFQTPHILFELSFSISSEILSRISQQERVEEGEATQMVLVPASLETPHFSVLFYDDQSVLLKGFRIAANRVADENEVFTGYLQRKRTSVETTLFSAKEQGIEIFEREVLLPTDKQNFILPQEREIRPAYLTDKDGKKKIETDKLSEFLFFYVKNPKILWNLEEEDQVRYGDSSVILQYDKRGIFQYTMLTESKEEEDLSMSEAYRIGVEFLKKDYLLSEQEYKLRGYDWKDGHHHFYFDYYFRGYPMIWSEKRMQAYGTSYPMELVVGKDEVVRYRRLLLQKDHLLQQGNLFQLQYKEALNRFFQKYPTDKIKKMQLCYFEEEEQMHFGWEIMSDEKVYLKE